MEVVGVGRGVVVVVVVVRVSSCSVTCPSDFASDSSLNSNTQIALKNICSYSRKYLLSPGRDVTHTQVTISQLAVDCVKLRDLQFVIKGCDCLV